MSEDPSGLEPLDLVLPALEHYLLLIYLWVDQHPPEDTGEVADQVCYHLCRPCWSMISNSWSSVTLCPCPRAEWPLDRPVPQCKKNSASIWLLSSRPWKIEFCQINWGICGYKSLLGSLLCHFDIKIYIIGILIVDATKARFTKVCIQCLSSRCWTYPWMKRWGCWCPALITYYIKT